jgi:hypothetical protein
MPKFQFVLRFSKWQCVENQHPLEPVPPQAGAGGQLIFNKLNTNDEAMLVIILNF